MSHRNNRVLPTLTALGVGVALAAAALAAQAQSGGNRGAAAAGQMNRPAVTLPSQATGRTLPAQATGRTLPAQATELPQAGQDGITTALENIDNEFAKQVVSGELSGKDIAVDRADPEAKDIVAAAGDDLEGREVAKSKGAELPEESKVEPTE
ncbi:MAG: hypothetical protein WD793_12850 [Steroidobacteraceae bacterium]